MENHNKKTDLAALRQKAEKLPKIKLHKTGPQLSRTEMQKTLHELHLHQIELEEHISELLNAKLQAEALVQKYHELYNYAPSGNFTLSEEGDVIEVNLNGAKMLGVTPPDFKNSPFDLIISIETKPVFKDFLRKIFKNNTRETCEVIMVGKDKIPMYAYLTGNLTQNGKHCLINAADISERKQAGEIIRKIEGQNRAIILQTAMDGFWLVDMQGRLQDVNSTYCQMSGYSMEELLAMNLSSLEVVETDEDTSAHMAKVILNGHDRFETRHRRKDGSIFDVEISAQYQHMESGRFVAFLHDISERKLTERYREMTREILQILNEPENILELIGRVLSVLKTGTGFDAVGIRLEDGEDFPYVSQKGFSRDFLLTENTLIDHSSDGSIYRDCYGKACLACSCGLVISGKHDPADPLFTPGGSWWTNNSLPLLKIPPGKDARNHPRNQCITNGYASQAIVPIRNKDRIVGLIQLNNFRKESFSSYIVQKLEGIASHIGAAIVRNHAEETLRESEKRRLAILENAMDGFWLLDMQGRLLEVNETYCRMSGYSANELRSMHISNLEASNAEVDISSKLQRVVVQGDDRFESRHRRKDGSTFDIEVSIQYQSDEGGQFVTFLHDITGRKQVEENLRQSEERYKSLFQGNYSTMLLVNPDTGEIKDANPAASQYYGWTHSELCGKNISELNTLTKQEIIAEMQKAKEEKRNQFFFKHRLANGEVRDVELFSGPIKFSESILLYSIVHDISERKQAERALHESEKSVRLKLQSILSPEGSITDLELNDIIDAPSIQKLMDSFYELAQIPMAIIDINANVLVGVGWQDICTKFHRVHPESCKNCVESDLHLTKGISEGEFRLYKCRNHLWDIATPIYIGGEHKGNLFMGQFFFEDEPIEYKLFRKQAIQYGFEEQEYIDALDKVPRISKQKIEHAKSFFLNLSYSISQLSYSNIKLARAITQQKVVEDALKQSEELLNKAQEIAQLGSWSLDLVTNRLTWSNEIYRIFGLQPQEFSANYEGFLDAVHPQDRNAVHSAYTTSIMENRDSYEIEHRIIRKHSGELRHVYEKCEHMRNASGKIIRSVGMIHDITERKRSEEAILENERLLRESQAAAHIGSYSADLINNSWKASPEIYEIFGIDQTYPHTLDGWICRIHPDFQDELVAELSNVKIGKNIFEHEYKIIRFNDGQERWVQGFGEFEYDEQSNPVRLIGTIQEITERKAKEKALNKLNQTLAALSKSSQAMSQSVNEADYLKQVCKIVVDDTDFEMVWIGFAEDDEAKTVRLMASAGYKDDYLKTIKISWNDSEYGRGPTGTAIRTGKISICNNILTDPAFKPWREQALKQGFASSIVFPLKNGDKTFGAITIYSKEPESFLEVEINLLSELANDLAHGITTIRLREANRLAEQELSKSHGELEVLVTERTRELQISNNLLKKEIYIRKQKEQSLKLTEQKYRTVADHTHSWEFWLDIDDSFIYCSPSCERITGYNSMEFLKKPELLFEIIHPDDLKGFLDHKKKENQCITGNPELQYRIVRNDGSIRWISHECQAIFNESGKFVGIRGSNRDITGRKEIEQQLITSNQKYKLLSKNISDGIFICKEGSFEYVNTAMTLIFGYEDHELNEMKMTQLIKPEYLTELEIIHPVKIGSNNIKNFECECLKKDKSTIIVDFLLNYVATDRVIYGVVHDITEKKQIQKNIVHAIIRTEENERAHFSKELHDGLGPILSTIKLYLQWSERPKTHKSRQEIIHKAAEILEEALTTVKEISNKLSPHLLTNYGLTSAIQSFVDKVEVTSAINIAFESNVSRRLGNDIEAALYRAVIECINNTLKHSQAKNITITIRDTFSQIMIRYSDNGIGFNLEETFSMRKGLGLFNLQNRIQTIGGKITLLSQPGNGVDYQIIVNI